jgi:cytochrome c oxidase subunit 3
LARTVRSFPMRTEPVILGTCVFLASELMFFAALFASYYDLKSTSAVWPPPYVHLDELGTAIGTVFLAMASATMFPFIRALKRGNMKAAYAWLYASIVSGIAFLGFELRGYAKQGFNMHTSAYGTVYMTMTGFHFLHVIVGVILLTALYFSLRSPTFTSTSHAGAEAISYYWHFVFVVWIGIYTTIYWIR